MAYTKLVLDILSDNGCHFLCRGKSSHEMWYSPINKRAFTVVDRIENRHTANGILWDGWCQRKGVV